MKKVNAKLVKAEVANFIPRENLVEVSILIDDGNPKKFSKSMQITEPVLQAEALLKEVRQRLKKAHESKDIDYSDPLSGITHIHILNDDDATAEKLARFLAAIKEKIRSAMRNQLSYFDLRNQVTGLNCNL